MQKDILHRPALAALLTLATSDERWPSRSKLAADAGIVPSILSDALNPERNRGLSDAAIDSLCGVLPGCTREALILPVMARPGDVETVRLVAELRALRSDVNYRVDEVARAIRERNINGG